MPSKEIKLNLGCGSQPLKGYINIDSEKKCKPDLVHDFVTHTLPYKDNSVSEVVCFHTIEHISKRYHKSILAEIHRVLKPGAPLYLSYPDFWTCANYWKKNHKGDKAFWHATMFGLQQYPSDFHVSAMDPIELHQDMAYIGFTNIKTVVEKHEEWNRVTVGYKGEPYADYEKLIADDVKSAKFKKLK